MNRLHALWARVSAWPERRVRWAVWGVLAVPFVVAAVVLWTRHYHPVLDLAMTELRVRDVGGRHTPLIGLPGRIGVFPDQGSHPGPLSFWLLAPTYRVLGASAWGLLVAMIVLNLVAMWLVLWLAGRRGGVGMVLAMGALLALVVRGYGFDVVTQPWNPYLPLLFWLVVLLATWGVVLGDRALVVVVAAVGSLCAQTHLPYLGIGLGMGALCVAALVVDAVRRPAVRRDTVRWLGVSALVTLVAWVGPIADQLRRDPGNLRMLADYFRNPPEEPVGTGEGVRLLLRHLDVTRLGGALWGGDGFVTRAAFHLDGSVVPGLVLLGAWVACAALAWRMRHRRLLALDVVVGWAMVLGVVSMSRIFGKVWYYLTLWMWLATALALVTVAWTVVAWFGLHRDEVRARRGHLVRTAMGALVAVVGIGSWAALTVEAGGAHAPEEYLSDTLAELVGPTADALDASAGTATGRDGRYLVTWDDARYFGSQGYGLVNELERRGFTVGVPATWRVPVTPQRVMDASTADAEVRLATGVYIERVAALPGAVEVVRYDPRDADDLAEYDRLEAEVTEQLTADGLSELVPMLETNLFGLQIDPRVSPAIQADVDRMLHLGTPTAVFLLPPGSPL